MENLHVYPEGNLIALTYHNHPSDQHTADLKRGGDRLGFIKISELYDPEKRGALKERITKYFSTTPHTPQSLERAAIEESLSAVLTGAMAAASKEAIATENIAKLLDYEGDDRLKKEIRDSLRHVVGAKGLPINGAGFSKAVLVASKEPVHPAQLISDIHQEAIDELKTSFYRRPERRLFSDTLTLATSYHETLDRLLTSEEKASLSKTASRATFSRLTSFAPLHEANAMFESFWADHGAGLINKETKQKFEIHLFGPPPRPHPELENWLKKHLPDTDPVRMKEIYDQFAIEAERNLYLGKSYAGRVSMFRSAEIWKKKLADPQMAAEELLQELELQRDVKYLYPETEIVMRSKGLKQKIVDFMHHLPPAARQVIERDGMHIVVGNDPKNIMHLLPQTGGILGSLFQPGLAGASLNRTLYLNASFADHPHLVSEELIHGVDEKLGYYTMSDAWKKAFERDFSGLRSNRVAKALLEVYGKQKFADGESKSNGAFTMYHERFPSERYVEALPDMMHLERSAKEILNEKGKIKSGLFSSVSTVDEAMHEAFPNLWKLYKGPPQGSKLFQSTDGKVHIFTAGDKVSEHVKPVKSFVEACEEFVAGLGKAALTGNAQKTLGAKTPGLLEKVMAKAIETATHVHVR